MRMIGLKPSVVGLLQAAAFLTAVFSLATLPNHLHRFLELFSHFRLQYLVAAIILCGLLFALRSRRWAALMLVVAGVNALPVAPWYVAEARAATAADPVLKLLLSNVYSGNPDTGAVIDLVLAESPDLVFLQELTPGRAEDLGALRDRYPYSLNMPREDNFGIAVLSRHPFTNAGVVESPPFRLPTLSVEVDIAGTGVAFVTTHPLPPIGRTGFDSRNEHLASVAELVNRYSGPRVLIGDLNTTMWGDHYARLVADTGLVDVRHGFGILPTWPTHLPFAMIPIDHCLVSEQFGVLAARTGTDVGSDHLPLIVELSIAESANE